MKLKANKRLLLSCAASLLSAAYGILRPLKISLFFQIVGKEYFPISKMLMCVLVTPLVYLYSKTVDSKKKHEVLYTCFLIYGILIFLLTCFLAHPVYGLANTNTSPFRILGWCYSIAIDFYSTFVIGAFWAFINSTSTPDFAKKNYSFIYTFVKIGGILATGLSYLFLQNCISQNGAPVYFVAVGGILTLLAIIPIWLLNKFVPSEELVGYSEKLEVKKSTSFYEGFKIILTQPYTFGIFIIFYFYDVIFTIVEYQTSIKLYNSLGSQITSLLFLSAAISQIVGIFLTLFLTTFLLKKIKLSTVLSIMPIFAAIIVISIWLFPSIAMSVAAITLLPAIHYSINSPALEMLFIPTTKDIQFKTKAWIDSFGKTLSKTSGSTLNFILSSATFSLVPITIWVFVAVAIGKKYTTTVETNSIIGD